MKKVGCRNMISYLCKDIGIHCSFDTERKFNQNLNGNFGIIQNMHKKLKNSESNRFLRIKKNINLYIPLMTMLSSRGCL